MDPLPNKGQGKGEEEVGPRVFLEPSSSTSP
jgi:hypothetical protein